MPTKPEFYGLIFIIFILPCLIWAQQLGVQDPAMLFVNTILALTALYAAANWKKQAKYPEQLEALRYVSEALYWTNHTLFSFTSKSKRAETVLENKHHIKLNSNIYAKVYSELELNVSQLARFSHVLPSGIENYRAYTRELMVMSSILKSAKSEDDLEGIGEFVLETVGLYNQRLERFEELQNYLKKCKPM